MKKIRVAQLHVRFYDGTTVKFDAYPDNHISMEPDGPIDPFPVNQWITVEMTQEEEEPEIGLRTDPGRIPRGQKLYVVTMKARFLRATGMENFRDDGK